MNIRCIVTAAMFLIASRCAICQTNMIAHESHSGSIQSFRVTGEDNFGMSPRTIDSVVKISDTSVIEFSNYGADTVYRGYERTFTKPFRRKRPDNGELSQNDPPWLNQAIGIDSLRKRFPDIKFIGFDKKKKQRAGLGADTQRNGRMAYAAEPDAAAPRDRTSLLILLGAVLTPALGYGIWRSEKGRKA